MPLPNGFSCFLRLFPGFTTGREDLFFRFCRTVRPILRCIRSTSPSQVSDMFFATSSMVSPTKFLAAYRRETVSSRARPGPTRSGPLAAKARTFCAGGPERLPGSCTRSGLDPPTRGSLNRTLLIARDMPGTVFTYEFCRRRKTSWDVPPEVEYCCAAVYFPRPWFAGEPFAAREIAIASPLPTRTYS